MNRVKLFFVIVGDHDIGRLNQLIYGHREQNRVLAWGFLPNAVTSIWNQIDAGDLLYFAHEGENFSIRCKVGTKQIDSELSIKLWGTDFRSRALNHIVLFSQIENANIGFHEMLRYGQKISEIVVPGIYPIRKQYTKKLLKEKENVNQMEQSLSAGSLPTVVPIDFDGAPSKTRQDVIRYIRDSSKSKLLKMKYQDRCQICAYRIELPDGSFYSEVHHIRPLKHGGADNFNNMIVLCPNHHAAFDFCALLISNDGTTVIDKAGNTIGKLNVEEDHELSRENIEYLSSRVLEKTK